MINQKQDRNRLMKKASKGEAGAADAVILPREEPRLSEGALYGIAGDVVRKMDPYSEADPAAVLFQLLISFGSAAGSNAYFQIEGDRHAANLFAVIVGQSSKARKGTSWGVVRAITETMDPQWWGFRQATGLSSGEGLIFQVRDELADKNGDTIEGMADKRLLVFEGELAQVLRVLKREGNTLSGVIRNAWDGKTLSTMTRNNPIRATNPHISIIGHITNEELQKEIRGSAEMFNGFANRFLWVFAKRSKLLPRSIPIPEGLLDAEIERLKEAVAFAKSCGRMKRDSEAEDLWEQCYTGHLSFALTGLLGAATSRGEAQVVRLSLIFALLDCSPIIRAVHLRAALECWQYCGDSAQYIFGERQADPTLNKIIEALRANPAGLTKTELMSDVFSGNCEADKLSSALRQLEESGQVRREGRPGQRGTLDHWLPASPFKMYEFNELRE